jgi:uracil-DNA glycosylase
MMQGQGEPSKADNPLGGMPATDDEIREKYLERAIRELNHFTRELQGCTSCPRGNLMPVLGSGHPQADVFLLKYAPTPAEIEEGVAFYGRAGTALMKSFKRLDIDPLAVYGTLCVKCPVADTTLAAPECVARLVEEIAIVQPKIVVVMGPDALDTLNEIALPLARAASSSSPRRSTRSTRRTSTRRSTRRPPSGSSGARCARSASGTRTSRRTD